MADADNGQCECGASLAYVSGAGASGALCPECDREHFEELTSGVMPPFASVPGVRVKHFPGADQRPPTIRDSVRRYAERYIDVYPFGEDMAADLEALLAEEMKDAEKRIAELDGIIAEQLRHVETLESQLDERNARVLHLEELINSPHVENFLEAVRTEAAHQQLRWSTEHDAGKADPDWFWLIGYLAGKAIRPGAVAKKLHHIITTAAACLNWHAHVSGARTAMRPGIEPPQGELDG